MNEITFPLKLNSQGPAVADLQDALQLCLDRGALFANDVGARQRFSTLLKPERGAQGSGDATAILVRLFQPERPLPPTGGVDEPTANALNALLKEWGLLNQPPEPAAAEYQVNGKVS